MTTFADKVGEIVDDLELQKKYDKSIIKHRFLDEISYYEQKRDHTKKYYNIFRFIVTTGSILLPAIISMGQMDPTKLPKNFDIITYWASWTISLSVTASNGFLQLFSLDKNYFSYSMVVEQLKTEGWQFFQLSGKYEDCESHKEAYKPFSKSIENIKRKQVEKEFPGKADVSKGKATKKENNFDFQAELMKQQMPELQKVKDTEMKLNQLDSLLGILSDKKVASTVGNVKELLTEDIESNSKEISKEVVSEAIEKAVA